MRSGKWVAAQEEAQRRWPGVRLDAEQFGQHLQHLGWTESLPPRACDVYLSCACAAGDEQAWRHFEATYIGPMRAAAARICPEPAAQDEVLQRVRHKLAVGPSPGLLKYTGKGSLLSWLRAVTRRAALDVRRELGRVGEPPRREPSDSLRSSMESRFDRSRYLPAFERSLANAFKQLAVRDRNLLRMHYANGVGIDALGQAYGVHRATAARWIERIRQSILAAVRADLTTGGDALSQDEFAEVVRLMRGRLTHALDGWDAASRATASGLFHDEAQVVRGARVKGDA